jgi:hypothetical protein
MRTVFKETHDFFVRRTVFQKIHTIHSLSASCKRGAEKYQHGLKSNSTEKVPV